MPFGQVAVAGVHRDDAVLDARQQFERIFAGQKRVARIVVDAEVGRVDAIDQVAEHVHLLGELGILPVVVLVVVFEDQRHAAGRGVRNAGLDALGGVAHAVAARDFGPALAGEHAAVLAAQRDGHVDPALFQVDLLLAERGIGMREVGRAAEHRDRQPLVLDQLAATRPRSCGP